NGQKPVVSMVLNRGLRSASTLAEASEINDELSAGGKLFCPQVRPQLNVTRVFWNIGLESFAGGAVAGLSGGEPAIGAIAGAARELVKYGKDARQFGRTLFGLGGFDLARRVRREVGRAAPGNHDPSATFEFGRAPQARSLALRRHVESAPANVGTGDEKTRR